MDKIATNDSFQTVVEERRIKNVGEARSLFSKFETDNTLRANSFTQVRNQLEGGRPYDPNELARTGMGWQANVNFGDAQADRDRVLTPIYKAVHGGPRTISVTIDSQATDSGQWEAAFEEGFDSFLDDWGQDYIINFNRKAKNLIDFGCGPAMWDSPTSPRDRAVNFQRMYFPRNTRMNMSSWEVVGIVDDVGPSELWDKIRNEDRKKSAKQVGWNEQAVKNAIVFATGQQWNGRDFTRWQDMLVNNDIVISGKFQPVATRILYVKNYDNTIGKYIFCMDAGAGDEFLYQNEHFADSFEEIFGCVWWDTGVDAMVHSIKGFGIKNFHRSLLINRMRNRIVDGASFAMALNLKKPSDLPDEVPPVENYGTINYFPANVEQFTTYPQFNQGMQVLEMLEQNSAQNNSQYRQAQQQIAQSDTATQANILANMQGEVTEASMALLLAQIGESWFEPMMKRLRRKGNADTDAKEFVKRLIEKGVPEDVIYTKRIRVKCGTTAGMANPIMRGQTLMQTAAYLSTRPGANMRWLDEQIVANKLGSAAVSKALLPEGEDSEPAQRREAILENMAFGQGQPLPVDPSDAHPEHIDEHLKPTEQALMQYQQTGKYDAGRIAADVLSVEHSGQHLTLLQKDETRKPIFIALKARLTAVQSHLRGIISKVQQQQQAAQGQPQQPIQGGVPVN